MEKKEPRSWGVGGHEGIRHSGDNGCPYCYWKVGQVVDIEHMAPYVVGFSTYYSYGQPDVPGGLIFECPECFKNFWYHTYSYSISHLKDVGVWPKT